MAGLQRVRPNRGRRSRTRALAPPAPAPRGASPSASGPGRGAEPACPRGPIRARGARRRQVHQRDEPVDLRLAREQLGQDAPQAQRLLASAAGRISCSPAVAVVALVEDQIDDFEHRGQPRSPSSPRAGTANGTRRCRRACASRARCAAPTADSARQDRPERSPSVVSPHEQTQRERHARVGRQQRVAGGEDEPQQVVVEGVVGRGREVVVRPSERSCRVAARAPRSCAGGASARRIRSMPRCLAVAISQAPGLSGTPDSGHCSSAATSAS